MSIELSRCIAQVIQRSSSTTFKVQPLMAGQPFGQPVDAIISDESQFVLVPGALVPIQTVNGTTFISQARTNP